MRHIAFYKFVRLHDLPALKKKLLGRLHELEMRGTILLAHEGLNGGLAGSKESIRSFQLFLEEDPHFRGIKFKESEIPELSYKRTIVKIKKEIVTMGVPEMSPPQREAERVAPKELQQWLSEGRELLLLDTRNNYEVSIGTFKNAHAIDVNHFSHFPDKAKALPKDWRGRTVVSFCTGGIRCEKAAPFLDSLGFENVYQLDGGILRYFEEVGDEHWQGECFVFDERVAVDATLKPSGAFICSGCQKVWGREFHGKCPDCEKQG